jgi:hypothetical protein
VSFSPRPVDLGQRLSSEQRERRTVSPSPACLPRPAALSRTLAVLCNHPDVCISQDYAELSVWSTASPPRPGASQLAAERIAYCVAASCRDRSTSADSNAAITAPQPLSTALCSAPHRSYACSSVSQVRTALPTGVPVSTAT